MTVSPAVLSASVLPKGVSMLMVARPGPALPRRSHDRTLGNPGAATAEVNSYLTYCRYFREGPTGPDSKYVIRDQFDAS